MIIWLNLLNHVSYVVIHAPRRQSPNLDRKILWETVSRFFPSILFSLFFFTLKLSFEPVFWYVFVFLSIKYAVFIVFKYPQAFLSSFALQSLLSCSQTVFSCLWIAGPTVLTSGSRNIKNYPWQPQVTSQSACTCPCCLSDRCQKG